MSELSKTKIGVRVFCVVVGLMKKPIGRSAPMYGRSVLRSRVRGLLQGAFGWFALAR